MNAINDALHFPSPGEIKLGGYGGEMIDFTVKEQLTDPETWKLFVNQFRVRQDSSNGGWRGEYWGKMMRGAALTYRATKNEKLYSIMADTVRDLLTTQDSLGRITSYTPEDEFKDWDVWSRKYVMLGLIYFLEVCKSKTLSKRIISALKKHADYIVKKIGNGRGKISIFDTSVRVGALNSCSILEPFVKLYLLTGKKSYFDFATYIVETGFCQDKNLIELCLNKSLYPYQFPQTKAYEMTSCFEGLLEYYKVTGNPEHLRAVENFVELISESDYTIVGGSGCKHEFLDNSSLTQTEPATDEVMQETCVTVTFIKLCAKLLAVTGNAKYAELIERSGLNALYGAVNNGHQKMKKSLMRTWLEGGKTVIINNSDGFPFDSYSPLFEDRRGKRVGGMQLLDGGRSYGCCVCIGSAGTAITSLFAIMKRECGIHVNLYNDAKFETKHLGEQVRLTVKANPYHYRGATIKVIGNGQFFELSLRIPKWAENFSLSVNGERYTGEALNGYLTISRIWGDDKVEIDFKTPVRMRVLNGKIAFTKGPIALSRDSRFGSVSEPIALGVKDGKSVRARRIENTRFTSNMTYEIDTQDGILTLCDYAQAGKNYDDSDSMISVWHKVK